MGLDCAHKAAERASVGHCQSQRRKPARAQPQRSHHADNPNGSVAPSLQIHPRCDHTVRLHLRDQRPLERQRQYSGGALSSLLGYRCDSKCCRPAPSGGRPQPGRWVGRDDSPADLLVVCGVAPASQIETPGRSRRHHKALDRVRRSEIGRQWLESPRIGWVADCALLQGTNLSLAL